MPQYKLYYFDIRGLAEPIRLSLVQAGVPFEDVRIKREEWPNMKEKFPFGQVPVLEVDGKQLTQSAAILRYIAAKHGLQADNEWNQAVGDELATSWMDMMAPLVGAMGESDPAAKKQKFEEFLDEFMKPRLKIFNDILSKSASGFIAGGKVAWYDFSVYNALTMAKDYFHMPLSAYPHLEKYIQKIESLPKVKQWQSEHPNAPFSIAPSPLDLDLKKLKEEMKAMKTKTS